MSKWPMICVNCQVEMKVDTVGALVQELFQNDTKVYRIWPADLMKCPGCGIRVISRFADKPMVQHFEHAEIVKLKKYIQGKRDQGKLFNWREKLKKEVRK